MLNPGLGLKSLLTCSKEFTQEEIQTRISQFREMINGYVKSEVLTVRPLYLDSKYETSVLPKGLV